MVRPDRAEHVQFRGGIHGGDLRAEDLGELYGKRAEASSRPIDQQLLPGLDVGFAKEL
jgi:hypothetical protein